MRGFVEVINGGRREYHYMDCDLTLFVVTPTVSYRKTEEYIEPHVFTDDNGIVVISGTIGKDDDGYICKDGVYVFTDELCEIDQDSRIEYAWRLWE